MLVWVAGMVLTTLPKGQKAKRDQVGTRHCLPYGHVVFALVSCAEMFLPLLHRSSS